jgi:hypothetical protein
VTEGSGKLRNEKLHNLILPNIRKSSQGRCNTNRGDEKSVQNFCSKAYREETAWKTEA